MARPFGSVFVLFGSGLTLLAGCQDDRPPAQRFHGPLIASPVRCADFDQAVYFEPGQAQITRQADNSITAALARARRCRVTGVSIVGLADAPGSPDANLALSQRRADAARAELHRKGLDTVDIDTKAVGSAVAQTAEGQARPLRRRAVLTFHLSPPA